MQQKSMQTPICYTVDQACTVTGIGKTKIYEALDSGLLPAKKWGKRTIILKTDLQKFINGLESYAPQAGGKND